MPVDTVSNGGLIVDLYDSATRLNLDVKNADVSKTWTIPEASAGTVNRLNLWAWKSTSATEALTFSNYKVKIKLEKASASTSYTPTGIYTTYNSTYGTLPTPTRTGYTFAGWYTAASGGTKVTNTTVVNTASNHTLYAHWTANKYKVLFDTNDKNGINLFSVDSRTKTVNGITYTICLNQGRSELTEH